MDFNITHRMITKHLFVNKPAFENFQRVVCKETILRKYYIYDFPETYPCIGILREETENCFLSINILDCYIYPSDFYNENLT